MRVSSLYTPDELKLLCTEPYQPEDANYIVCVLSDGKDAFVHIFEVKDCLLSISGINVYATTHVDQEHMDSFKFPVEVSPCALTLQDILYAHLQFDSEVFINLVRTLIWRTMMKTTDKVTQSHMTECRLIEPEADEPWFSQLSLLEKLGIHIQKEESDDDLVPPSYWESLWRFRHRISKMLLRMQ